MAGSLEAKRAHKTSKEWRQISRVNSLGLNQWLKWKQG